MCTFVPNKLFGQLLGISPKNVIFLKAFYSGFSYIEVWMTDQNSKPLVIEDKINNTLVINEFVKYRKWHIIKFNLEMEYLKKVMDFCIWLKI